MLEEIERLAWEMSEALAKGARQEQTIDLASYVLKPKTANTAAGAEELVVLERPIRFSPYADTEMAGMYELFFLAFERPMGVGHLEPRVFQLKDHDFYTIPETGYGTKTFSKEVVGMDKSGTVYAYDGEKQKFRVAELRYQIIK